MTLLVMPTHFVFFWLNVAFR